MRFRFALLHIFGILLLISACVSVPQSPPREISAFGLQEIFPLASQVDKALVSARQGLICTLSTQAQEVVIYKDKQRINVLGGLAGFSYLSDLAIGLDGDLWLLDSVARQIRKYSPEGKATGILELKNCQQPTHIALLGDQTIYIYDAAPAEIICYSALDGSELYRFGRFQLKQISSLSCNRDYLVAYSRADNQSRIFSTLGQWLRDEAGQTVFDVFNNAINLTGKTLKSSGSAAYLPLGKEVLHLGIESDLLILNQSSELLMLKISYANEP